MKKSTIKRSDDAFIREREFFVAMDGDNTNPGTLEEPFQTLEKAKTEVQKILPTLEVPITVWVRGGKYYLNDALNFTVEDTGSQHCPITYAAYQNEEVILSGGKKITSHWMSYKDGIMVADIETGLKFDQLFLNGKRQTMARYPNVNPLEPILDGYSADAISPSRVATWDDPTTGFVRGLHDREWGGNSFKITGVKDDGHLLLEWAGDNNRGSGLHDQYVVVENIFEELDAEGEWFYDEKKGKLYLKPPAEIDLNEAMIEVALLEELIKIEGSQEQKVEHLTFSGFIFTHTHRTLFTRSYEPLLRSDWKIARAGTIFLRNAEYITIQDSRFHEVGGNAIFLSGYNYNHLITNNEFIGSGSSDIQVVGLQSAVRYPSTWEDHKTDIRDKEKGPITNEFPRDINISYNHMFNMGVFEKQSSGINIAMSKNIHVSHNTIHHGPRAGINIGTGVWGGHIVEYNDIFDMVLETDDHGPFNSWGRSRFWSLDGFDTNGNRGELKKPYVKLDAEKPIKLRNNRIKHDGEWGFDLDDGASNYEIYDNLLLNTGIKLREGFFRNVYNNILIHGAIHFHVGYAGNDDVIKNNIIVSREPYEFIQDDPVEGNRTYKKNLFWNYGKEIILVDDAEWKEKGFDVNSKSADPHFKDPEKMNYGVENNSQALLLGFMNFPMDEYGKPNAPDPLWPDNKKDRMVQVNVGESLLGGEINKIFSEGQRSAFGLPDRLGVYFSKIPIDSEARSQGFRVNDVIRELNSKKVLDLDNLWEIYNSIESGSEISATVYRNQQEVMVTFIKSP